MSLLIHSLLDALVLFWCLTAACLIALVLRKPRLFRLFLGLAGAWLFVIGVSPIPQWLIHRLERTYPVVALPEISQDSSLHILVMGGGHTPAPDLPYMDQLSDPARARLNEAVRLHQLLPGSKIVCSGYSSTGRITQAEVLARAALELGVTPADTLMVRTPANSAEEARDYVRRFGKQHRLILVTSAFHMPRAVEIFRRKGLDPLPAPTDHYIKEDPRKSTYDFWPSSAKIYMMTLVIHEYGGQVKLAMN